jgi:hypothetical protein
VSTRWSGPSRALATRIELYDLVSRALRQSRQFSGQRVNPVALERTLGQRIRLMSSMPWNGPLVGVDGRVAALGKDDNAEMFSKYNITRAIGTLSVEAEALSSPETHFVSEHVMNAAWSVADMADDEPMWATDLPAEAGLIVFETPLLLDDLHPKTGTVVPGLTMPCRAIAWTTNPVWTFDGEGNPKANDGIWYGLYCDAEAFKQFYVTAFEDLIGPGDAFLEDELLPIWMSDSSGWAFGAPWKRGGTDHDRTVMGGGLIHDAVAQVRRFILAYFRWTWSRVLVSHRHDLDRAERRRLGRVGLPEQGYLKVVRLRREAEAIERGEDVADAIARTHSWLVSAHPRRQHYRSLGPARLADGSFNPASHRLVWIDTYVAGDGPLVVGTTVKAAVR